MYEQAGLDGFLTAAALSLFVSHRFDRTRPFLFFYLLYLCSHCFDSGEASTWAGLQVRATTGLILIDFAQDIFERAATEQVY